MKQHTNSDPHEKKNSAGKGNYVVTIKDNISNISFHSSLNDIKKTQSIKIYIIEFGGLQHIEIYLTMTAQSSGIENS